MGHPSLRCDAISVFSPVHTNNISHLIYSPYTLNDGLQYPPPPTHKVSKATFWVTTCSSKKCLKSTCCAEWMSHGNRTTVDVNDVTLMPISSKRKATATNVSVISTNQYQQPLNLRFSNALYAAGAGS